MTASQAAPGARFSRPSDPILDRCPGILVLHRAEDGFLARIRLPGGRISGAQLEGVAELSNLGSGLVELTSRANLQIRGLPDGAGAAFAERLHVLGLFPSDTHERVRNVLASSFAGRHRASIVATDGLVAKLDNALCASPNLARLSGRFLFGIDDGAGFLADQGLDVGLMAEHSIDGSKVFRLDLDGLPTSEVAQPNDAVPLAIEATHAFLQMSEESSHRIWRVRDLPGGARALALRLGFDTAPLSPDKARRTPHLGIDRQVDEHFSVTALPRLGRLSQTILLGLAEIVAETGSDVRLSPQRMLTVVDIVPERADEIASRLKRLGLEVTPSGWQGLSACAGLGACARAAADVRSAAEMRASVRDESSPLEHWAACEKRCGKVQENGVNVHYTDGRFTIEQNRSASCCHSVAEVSTYLSGRR